MVVLSLLLGGVAGLALLGFYLVGPNLPRVMRPASATAWLVVAFVVWPALGLLYLGLEALGEYLHDKTAKGRR